MTHGNTSAGEVGMDGGEFSHFSLSSHFIYLVNYSFQIMAFAVLTNGPWIHSRNYTRLVGLILVSLNDKYLTFQ